MGGFVLVFYFCVRRGWWADTFFFGYVYVLYECFVVLFDTCYLFFVLCLCVVVLFNTFYLEFVFVLCIVVFFNTFYSV